MRVFMGVGAWLLGVGAATAGSLLAVSLLGEGIAPTTSQQLTAAAVTQALATEATETSQPAVGPAMPTPSATHRHQPRPLAAPPPQIVGTSPASSFAPPWTPSASAQPASAQPEAGDPSPGPVSNVLTSQGGTVVAQCRLWQAYLVSWSPTQGYEAGTVARGPAATAQVTFESNFNSVTMVVSCSAGVPTATTTVGGGDDGGGGNDT